MSEDFQDSFEDEEEFILGHIFHPVEEDCWTAEILTNGKSHTFKLDTGYQFQLWGNHGPNLMLKRSNKQLKGNTKLTVLGTVQGKLCYKTRTVQETLYILKGQTSYLLSWTAYAKTSLISRIDQIDPSSSNLKSEFQVFSENFWANSIYHKAKT